jgi:hypothetical protein
VTLGATAIKVLVNTAANVTHVTANLTGGSVQYSSTGKVILAPIVSGLVLFVILYPDRKLLQFEPKEKYLDLLC